MAEKLDKQGLGSLATIAFAIGTSAVALLKVAKDFEAASGLSELVTKVPGSDAIRTTLPWGAGVYAIAAALLVAAFVYLQVLRWRDRPRLKKAIDTATFTIDRPTELTSVLDAVRGVNSLIWLTGESGSGKSTLVRLAAIPKLKADPNWLVVELDGIGANWETGAYPVIARAIREAMTTDQRDQAEQLGADPELRSLAQILEPRRLLLVFDQFDDVMLEHRGRFQRDKHTWRNAEELVQGSEFWKQISQLLSADLAKAIFVARSEASPGLEAVRFTLPRSITLSRLEPGQVGPELNNFLLSQIEGSSDRVPQLVESLTRDLERDGAVLPIRLRLAIRGLSLLGRLTAKDFQRAGGLTGLEALHLDTRVREAAREAGLHEPRVVHTLLEKLVDPGGLKTRSAEVEQLAELLPEPALGRVLRSLEAHEIARKVLSPDGKVAWRLDHDYLAGAFRELSLRQRRWEAQLREMSAQFRRATGALAKWRSLLSTPQQVAMVVAKWRGRLRFGPDKGYALLSATRWVLNIWVMLAVGGGIYYLARRDQEKVDSLFSQLTITTGDSLSSAESEALRKLAAAPRPIRELFVDSLVARADQIDRFAPRLPLIVHAVTGLHPDRRDALAKRMADRCSKVPVAQKDPLRACALVLASLVGKRTADTPEDAALLVAAATGIVRSELTADYVTTSLRLDLNALVSHAPPTAAREALANAIVRAGTRSLSRGRRPVVEAACSVIERGEAAKLFAEVERSPAAAPSEDLDLFKTCLFSRLSREDQERIRAKYLKEFIARKGAGASIPQLAFTSLDDTQKEGVARDLVEAFQAGQVDESQLTSIVFQTLARQIDQRLAGCSVMVRTLSSVRMTTDAAKALRAIIVECWGRFSGKDETAFEQLASDAIARLALPACGPDDHGPECQLRLLGERYKYFFERKQAKLAKAASPQSDNSSLGSPIPRPMGSRSSLDSLCPFVDSCDAARRIMKQLRLPRPEALANIGKTPAEARKLFERVTKSFGESFAAPEVLAAYYVLRLLPRMNDSDLRTAFNRLIRARLSEVDDSALSWELQIDDADEGDGDAEARADLFRAGMAALTPEQKRAVLDVMLNQELWREGAVVNDMAVCVSALPGIMSDQDVSFFLGLLEDGLASYLVSRPSTLKQVISGLSSQQARAVADDLRKDLWLPENRDKLTNRLRWLETVSSRLDVPDARALTDDVVSGFLNATSISTRTTALGSLARLSTALSSAQVIDIYKTYSLAREPEAKAAASSNDLSLLGSWPNSIAGLFGRLSVDDAQNVLVGLLERMKVEVDPPCGLVAPLISQERIPSAIAFLELPHCRERERLAIALAVAKAVGKDESASWCKEGQKKEPSQKEPSREEISWIGLGRWSMSKNYLAQAQ